MQQNEHQSGKERELETSEETTVDGSIHSERTAIHSLVQANHFLSTEEIATYRQDSEKKNGEEKWTYVIDGKTYVLISMPIWGKDIKNEEQKRSIDQVWKRKEKGEQEVNETILVNALAKQDVISKTFSIPLAGLHTGVWLNYTDLEGDVMMTARGEVFQATFIKHIDSLRSQGMEPDEIATEIAGHIFHEAVHLGEYGLAEVLVEGRHSVGEVTPIAAQLAYYLSCGYKGIKSYDARRCEQGRVKITKGNTNVIDHDVGTCIAANILREHLEKTFPARTANEMNPIITCETIMETITEPERKIFIDSLKKGIANAADPAIIKTICEGIQHSKPTV